MTWYAGKVTWYGEPVPALYEQARRQLVTELERFGEGETAARLPARCPYTLQEVIGDWWPERR